MRGWPRPWKLPLTTNAGQNVRLIATPRKPTPSGEQPFAINSRANSTLRVWLSWQPARVRLLITAPETEHGLPVEEGPDDLTPVIECCVVTVLGVQNQ